MSGGITRVCHPPPTIVHASPRLSARLVRALVALALAATAAAAAGVAVAADPAPTVTAVELLEGIDQSAAGGYAPPDVQVAAGPGYVVEMVNVAVEILRTASSPPAQVALRPLDRFFEAAGHDLTDPRVLYDAISRRWYASIADIGDGAVRLAVSDGVDPTGGWRVWSFDAAGACPDQPRLATTDTLVVLAADVFTRCEGRFSRSLGAELWSIRKDDLLAGAAGPSVSTFGPSRAYASLTPAHSLSSTSTAYVVSVDSEFSSVVHLQELTGAPPGETSLQEVAAIPVEPLRQPPAADEPDGSGGSRADIETNDNRILDAVWESGRLWLSANTACLPVGDLDERACGRVAELSTENGTLAWQVDLGAPGVSTFFPSVRPDASGNVVIVYGRSAPALAPIVAVTARTVDGAFTDPLTIGTSAAPAGLHNDGRWGDYFGSARDPQDPSRVWVAGETGPAFANGSNDWTTRIAAIVVTPAGGQPPRVSVAPPGVRAHAAGGHAGAPVKLVYSMLDAGTAVRREVSVRWKGSLLFRRTTKPEAVDAGRRYAVVWRPAKRFRGTAKFCVRSISADGTPSPASCALVRIRR